LDCDVEGDVMLLCLMGAADVEVAVLASPSTAQWHAQGHDKRDSLFMGVWVGWVPRVG